MLDAIKALFRSAKNEAAEVGAAGEPDARPPTGSAGDTDRETSTNAQTQGAQDEPWSGSR